MNLIASRDVFQHSRDQRAQPRFMVALKALMFFGGTKYPVNIVNIAADGAMIESSAALLLGAQMVVTCGTINVAARVIRLCSSRQFGIRFARSLSASKLEEQISRSFAISSRREKRMEQQNFAK